MQKIRKKYFLRVKIWEGEEFTGGYTGEIFRRGDSPGEFDPGNLPEGNSPGGILWTPKRQEHRS